MNTLSGYFLALTAVFFWSLNYIIASYFAFQTTPFEIAFGRWLIACLILFPFCWKELTEKKNLLFKNKLLILEMATTGIVLSNTLIYYAGRTTSVTDMSLLNVLGPLLLILLSHIFLKTAIPKKQVLGILCGILGVLIIITKGNLNLFNNFSASIGDFFMLLNALCFAFYGFLQYKRPKEISQTLMLSVTALIGVILMIPVMLIEQLPTFPILELNWLDWSAIIYLGIFNSVLSYLAWNSALIKIGVVKTGVLYYLLPVFSTVEAFFILGQSIHFTQIIGGFFIIIGIVLINRR